MATQPNIGEVRAFPSAPPMPAVARILSRFNRDQLAGFIAVAIDLTDALDGDADIEDDDPAETAGDEQDAAYIEWHCLHPSKKRVANLTGGPEDDEDDDQDGCLAADDIGTASTPWHCNDRYPGDPGDAEENGDREGIP